jgi:hypothetical protein
MVKPGSILEIAFGDKLVYVHYVGRNSWGGDGVIVLPTTFDVRPVFTPEMFVSGYFVLYMAKAAVHLGLATVVGKLPPPAMPTRFRRKPGGPSSPWIIMAEDGSEYLRQVLSEEELLLPIETIWNHALLLEEIESGYRPELDGAPGQNVPVPPEGSSQDALLLNDIEGISLEGTKSHFLYFAKRRDATAAATALRGRGFICQEERVPDDKSWLVRAREPESPPADDADLSEVVEAIATAHGGEYDGWEIALEDDDRPVH